MLINGVVDRLGKPSAYAIDAIHYAADRPEVAIITALRSPPSGVERGLMPVDSARDVRRRRCRNTGR